MELLNQFRQYLKDKQVSANTVKNYSSDLSTFVDYLKSTNQYFSILTLPFILDSTTLENYKLWLTKKDPPATVNRRLSSLRKFMTFAIESNAISKDYTGTVNNLVLLSPAKGEQTLETVHSFLETYVSDSNTVKDYTSDINNFLVSNTPSRLENVPIEQRPFSPKKFWQWKNEKAAKEEKTATNVIDISNKKPSPNWAGLLLTLGAVSILLSLVALILVMAPNQWRTQNGRPGAFDGFNFSNPIAKIRTSSLKLIDYIVNALPSEASGLIDPTSSNTAASLETSHSDWTNKLERTWSNFWLQLSQPPLLDPSSKRP